VNRKTGRGKDKILKRGREGATSKQEGGTPVEGRKRRPNGHQTKRVQFETRREKLAEMEDWGDFFKEEMWGRFLKTLSEWERRAVLFYHLSVRTAMEEKIN